MALLPASPAGAVTQDEAPGAGPTDEALPKSHVPSLSAQVCPDKSPQLHPRPTSGRPERLTAGVKASARWGVNRPRQPGVSVFSEWSLGRERCPAETGHRASWFCWRRWDGVQEPLRQMQAESWSGPGSRRDEDRQGALGYRVRPHPLQPRPHPLQPSGLWADQSGQAASPRPFKTLWAVPT